MSWADHDHRGDYAPDRHEHGFYDLSGVAEQHHDHHDLENDLRDLREDLARLRSRVAELEGDQR